MIKFILLGAMMMRNRKANPLLIKPEVGTWCLVALGWVVEERVGSLILALLGFRFG